MSDLQIVVIIIACDPRAQQLPGPVRPGPPMNALDLLAGLAAVFVFFYLLWALLRPEDF